MLPTTTPEGSTEGELDEDDKPTTSVIIDQQCLICKEEVLVDPITIQCGHSYCGECIMTWLGRYGRHCPKCCVRACHLTGSDGISFPAPEPPTNATAGNGNR